MKKNCTLCDQKYGLYEDSKNVFKCFGKVFYRDFLKIAMIRIRKIELCPLTLRTVSLARSTFNPKLPHAMLASMGTCLKDRIPRRDAFRSAHTMASVSSQTRPEVRMG